MFELKPISGAAIPRALAKAERYRLLNEPQEAESICRDVLQVDPSNHEALVMLLLSITDQFGRGALGANDVKQILGELRDEYERAYYAGIIAERWIKAQLEAGAHPSIAWGWFLEAMDWYQKAQALAPAGNDDAILRWNSCVRLMQQKRIAGNPTEPENAHASFDDESPPR